MYFRHSRRKVLPPQLARRPGPAAHMSCPSCAEPACPPADPGDGPFQRQGSGRVWRADSSPQLNRLDPRSGVMAFSQILPRDLAKLLRQLSDDDLLQLSLTTAQGPPSCRLLEFGLILRRERQRRLQLRVQQLESCLWLSRRRGRLVLLLKRCLPDWLQVALRLCHRRPMP